WDVLMVSSDGREVNEVVKREGCPHQVIAYTRKITPFQDLYCIWLLIKLFKEERPDIMHTDTPKAGLLGMRAGMITKVPIRVHTLAGLPYILTARRKKMLLVAMEKLTFRLATEIWPNAFSLKDFIVSEKLVETDKI